MAVSHTTSNLAADMQKYYAAKIQQQDFRNLPANVQIGILNQAGIQNTLRDYILDLRDKALETIDDFLTLTDREKAKGHQVRKVFVTKAQLAHLSELANPGVKVKGPVATIYGIKLEARS